MKAPQALHRDSGQGLRRHLGERLPRLFLGQGPPRDFGQRILRDFRQGRAGAPRDFGQGFPRYTSGPDPPPRVPAGATRPPPLARGAGGGRCRAWCRNPRKYRPPPAPAGLQMPPPRACWADAACGACWAVAARAPRLLHHRHPPPELHELRLLCVPPPLPQIILLGEKNSIAIVVELLSVRIFLFYVFPRPSMKSKLSRNIAAAIDFTPLILCPLPLLLLRPRRH